MNNPGILCNEPMLLPECTYPHSVVVLHRIFPADESNVIVIQLWDVKLRVCPGIHHLSDQFSRMVTQFVHPQGSIKLLSETRIHKGRSLDVQEPETESQWNP